MKRPKWLLGKLLNTYSYLIGYDVTGSDEWKEVKDEASATEYLGILETATVLEQIHDNFAGVYVCIHNHFIFCHL